jgi:hypothetical protein
MPKVALYKSTLEGARDRASLSEEDLDRVSQLLQQIPSGMPRVELDDFPRALVSALLDDSKLRPAQRASIALYINGLSESDLNHDQLYNVKTRSPVDFGSTLAADTRRHPNVEIPWNGRWYPVIVRPVFTDDENKIGKVVHLYLTLGLGDQHRDIRWHVPPSMFVDEAGEACELTIMQVIEKFGFRRIQSKASDYNRRLVRCNQLAATPGLQVWIRGAVLEPRPRFWFSEGLSLRLLGTTEVPRRAVVEPSLDSEHTTRQMGIGTVGVVSPMPLVRVFSLDLKA